MIPKIKILFVIDGLSGGGKERQLVELLRWLDQEKYEIGVVTFSIPDRHYVSDVRALAHFFRELDLKKKLGLFAAMRRCFQDFSPEIVHAWDTFSMIYAWGPAHRRKLPVIDGSIRDAGVDRGWERLLKTHYLRKADVILSNSQAGLDQYRVAGKVVHNAIDRKRFLPNRNLSYFNLIMTANFTEYKDHMTFIDAAGVLLKQGTVDNVYLAGDGPNMEGCRAYARQACGTSTKRVHFLGKVRNVEKWLSYCRVGVLCSTRRFSEGLSNSVLEYMAAGLAPIVTDVGAIPEIIEDGGNGFLVEPGDSAAIVHAVTRLRQDAGLLQKIAGNASITLDQKFSFHDNYGQYSRIYEELLMRNK